LKKINVIGVALVMAALSEWSIWLY